MVDNKFCKLCNLDVLRPSVKTLDEFQSYDFEIKVNLCISYCPIISLTGFNGYICLCIYIFYSMENNGLLRVSIVILFQKYLK